VPSDVDVDAACVWTRFSVRVALSPAFSRPVEFPVIAMLTFET